MASCSKIDDVGVSQEESDDRDSDNTDKTATPRKKKRLKHYCMFNSERLKEFVMDMYSCRPMGASVARLIILVSGARSRSWN